MNSKQRRILKRKKVRLFPKGCQVYIGRSPDVYTVTHHYAGNFDASPMIGVTRQTLGGTRISHGVNYARLRIVQRTR